MAIINDLKIAKQYLGKSFKRKNMTSLKKAAHRKYRRNAKHAIHCEKEINEKPTLTSWHII